MRDFTLKIYRQFLGALEKKGYRFIRYDDFSSSQQSSVHSPQENIKNFEQKTDHQLLCILRHDVDLLPENSLATARIENELG